MFALRLVQVGPGASRTKRCRHDILPARAPADSPRDSDQIAQDLRGAGLDNGRWSVVTETLKNICFHRFPVTHQPICLNPSSSERTGRKGKAVASWKAIGLEVDTACRSLNGRTAAQYIWALRRLALGQERVCWQPKRRLNSKQHPLASGVKRRRLESADVREQGSVASPEAGLPLVVEVVWDSSNFASKDTQVNVVYCPVADVAAYTPPMTLRHVRWRSAEAGERLSIADREQCEHTRFKTKTRMECCDCIKYLNHVLQVAFGRSLQSFACPHPLKRMEPRAVRVYHTGSGRWYRVAAKDYGASASGTGVDVGVVELPDELLDSMSVNVLLATIDQKQSQWTAMHCCASPTALNLMFAFRSDSFHRSWHDFQYTMSNAEGGFDHSACQLNYALNVNYQQGYFLAKRREIKQDWQILFPNADAEFKSLYSNIALDARRSPSTSGADISTQYRELVLENETYDKKGIFLKKCSWYSIIEMLHQVDTVWHARKYMADKVAESFLMSKGKQAKERPEAMAEKVLEFMQNPPARGSQANAKETQKAEMRALRKRVGNALLLGPRLMHTENFVNGRIMYLISKCPWTEQSMWTQLKTTPEQDRDMAVRYATGLGEEMLKHMWRDSIFDAIELHRLGWRIIDNTPIIDLTSASGEVLVLKPSIPERLMSFLLHFSEARWWSYAWGHFALPEAFAAVLADGPQGVAALKYLHLLWKAATFAGSIEGAGNPSAAGVVSLRHQIYWLDWPITQWLLRLLAHFHWTAHATIVNYLRVFFRRLGDTLCVEETHGIGRGMEQRDQQPDVLNLLIFFGELLTENTPLTRRGVRHVCPSDSGAYTQKVDSKPPVPWARACCTEAPLPLPSGISLERAMSTGTFDSRTPASGRPSIAAAQALVHVYTHNRLELASTMWHCLALLPHTVVRTINDIFLMIAQGKFAARAWRGSPLATMAATPEKNRWGFNIHVDLEWIFAENIYDWHFIDVEWVPNLQEPETYGFVVAQEKLGGVPHVPAIVEAMVRRGPQKLRQEDRKNFTQTLSHGTVHGPAPKVTSQGGMPAERFLVQRLMDGHDRTHEYLNRLQK